MSAAPSTLHQRVPGLHVALRAGCPDALEVSLAPTDYQPTQTRSLQPDLLAVSCDDPGTRAVTRSLEVAVEPQRRPRVLVIFGSPDWVVDPLEPWFEVLAMHGDAHGETRRAIATDRCRWEQRYDITVVPADLLR